LPIKAQMILPGTIHTHRLDPKGISNYGIMIVACILKHTEVCR